MTQPQVTALSNPAAPAANAQFVSATTAPPTFVFRPGATLPNNLGVQQNVFTSPNSSGTDGLTLLQGVLNGLGLFPNIPLPSSTVEFDLSDLSPQHYTMLANMNLGQSCTLRGVKKGTIAITGIGQLLTNGFAISGIRTIEDLQIFAPKATGGGIISAFGTVTLKGNAAIGTTGLTGSAFFYDTVHGDAVVNVHDSSQVGANTFVVRSGSHLVLNLYDNANMSGASISVISGGAVTVNIYSSAVTVGSGLISIPGVTVSYLYNTNNTVIFSPNAGLNGQGRFTDFGQLCGFLSDFQDNNENWTIIIDATGDPTGNATIPANLNYVLPPTVQFLGVIDQSGGGLYEFPTLILSDGTGFTAPGTPAEVTFTNITVNNQNTSNPFITTALPNFIFNASNTTFSNTGGMPLIDVTGTAPTILNGNISQESFLGANTIELETGADAFLFFNQSTLPTGGITVSGGTIDLTADSMSTIDSSYYPDTTFAAQLSNVAINPVNSSSSGPGIVVGVNQPDLSYRADITGGNITYNLPNVVNVPFDGWRVLIWIALSTGVNSISLVPDGTAGEQVLDPTTGIYGANFTSTGLYSGQGTLYTVEWNLGGNAWLVSVKVPG